MQTLKPCPFCHKTSHLKIEMYLDPTFEEYHGFTVVCSAAGYEGTERGCGSSGGWGETEEDAATAWNTRPAAPVDGLERYDLEDQSQFNEGCYMRPDETGEYVRFEQAEAIIAAERAEKELAQQAEEEAKDLFWSVYSVYLAKGGVPVSTEKARSALSNKIATLEADNAALTARVKELVADKLDDEAFKKFQAFRLDDLETQLAAAEKISFEHGYVLACCNVVNLHDEPTIAHDTLSELGVTRPSVKAMNLSEYDLKALRKIERGGRGSPYGKTPRKARAALEAKP